MGNDARKTTTDARALLILTLMKFSSVIFIRELEMLFCCALGWNLLLHSFRKSLLRRPPSDGIAIHKCLSRKPLPRHMSEWATSSLLWCMTHAMPSRFSLLIYRLENTFPLSGLCRIMILLNSMMNVFPVEFESQFLIVLFTRLPSPQSRTTFAASTSLISSLVGDESFTKALKLSREILNGTFGLPSRDFTFKEWKKAKREGNFREFINARSSEHNKADSSIDSKLEVVS